MTRLWREKSRQKQDVGRNPVWCPVTLLIWWLSLTEIREGFLFPVFGKVVEMMQGGKKGQVDNSICCAYENVLGLFHNCIAQSIPVQKTSSLTVLFDLIFVHFYKSDLTILELEQINLAFPQQRNWFRNPHFVQLSCMVKCQRLHVYIQLSKTNQINFRFWPPLVREIYEYTKWTWNFPPITTDIGLIWTFDWSKRMIGNWLYVDRGSRI